MKTLRQSIFVLPVVATMIATTSPVAAAQRTLGTFGDWTAVVEGSEAKKICFIGSVPKTAEGKYTKRDEISVLVTHRPSDKVTGEISLTAGYTYKEGADVEAEIDGRTFKLFSRGGNAWAYDAAADKAMVAAMKAGAKMIVRGTSSRGTLTTDTYSLKGFSAGLAAIDKACGGS